MKTYQEYMDKIKYHKDQIFYLEEKVANGLDEARDVMSELDEGEE